MTIRYVGKGGSDGNDGLSWANRKLTLNGAEDSPVQAGDTVYVGPGVYREWLSVDVTGTSGNEISYIGDVTGENTDGVGGTVEICASNDDLVYSRSVCVTIPNSKDYRIFRGFTFRGTNLYCVDANGQYVTISDCVFFTEKNGTTVPVALQAGKDYLTVERCHFFSGYGIKDDVGSDYFEIRNCVFQCNYGGLIVGSVNASATVRNCLFVGSAFRAISFQALAGSSLTVYGSIFLNNYEGINKSVASSITEDYNCYYGNDTNAVNFTIGSNSVFYPPNFEPGILYSGIRFPMPPIGTLSSWSPLRNGPTDSGSPSDDFFGISRPASGKRSCGPLQFVPYARETTTKYSGTASMKMSDAGRVQFKMPLPAESVTISVYVYRETDYAGTLPQLVVKQPGQSDSTDTDTESSGQWNQLSVQLTPASSPGWVVIELVSNNTASSGSYAVYFDAVSVS